jgi:hypothetical protein
MKSWGSKGKKVLFIIGDERGEENFMEDGRREGQCYKNYLVRIKHKSCLARLASYLSKLQICYD